MAGYVANIEQGHQQPIPCHFTRNCLSGVDQRSYAVIVSVKTFGSARDIGAVREAAGTTGGWTSAPGQRIGRSGSIAGS